MAGRVWTNLEEYQHGTNPLLADSDGDGVNDDLDGNPLVADQGSDPDGPALNVIWPPDGACVP